MKDHNEDYFFWIEKDKIKLNIMTMITTFLPIMDFFFPFCFLILQGKHLMFLLDNFSKVIKKSLLGVCQHLFLSF